MKILLAHCRYRLRGGEDAVFDTEAAQLEGAGHEVVRVEFNNEAIDTATLAARVAAGIDTVWSRHAYARMAAALAQARPAVAHFHNTFPLMSPAVYFACAQAGVPVVQTLHNFRLLCANGIFLRDGKPCEACAGRRFFESVRHACYRDSRLASAAVAMMQYVHHGLGSYARKVDQFIALTEFARRKFVAAGLPATRFTVKPNSLDTDPGLGTGTGGFALFVGRLSQEKGVDTLIEAWRQLPGVSLSIAGEGPQRAALDSAAEQLGGQVQVLGAVSRTEVLRLMGAARVLIMPSECYEGFPMTVVEAYSRGLPVLASNIGSLGEIVVDGQTGRHFRPADPRDLARVVAEVWADPTALGAMRAAARQRFVERYGPQQNVQALLDIYSSLQAQRR